MNYLRRGLESIVLESLSAVPAKVGKVIRVIGFRPLFKRLDSSVTIGSRVRFSGTNHISIEKGVWINQYAEIHSWGNPIKIGANTSIDLGVSIRDYGHLGQSSGIVIGEHSGLGPYCCLAGPGAINIGSNCMIASHCCMYANNHGFDDLTRPMHSQPLTTVGITIEDDCWLGTGVKVLDGVTIGTGSVIGAGAVVSRDIPPYSVAVGVPARVIKSRKEQLSASPTRR
jgi:acetyltransferase-like isoleucine patch superfamily enzyme